ncbi:MAG: toxin-antitoxin system YwqK family antitoxin [Flavobacteriales bacterium]
MKYLSFFLALALFACSSSNVEEKVELTYPDGKAKLVMYFDKETDEKIMEREFYQNGKTKLEWNFKSELKNGEAKSFRADGKPWSSHTYLNDTLQGPYKTWHENGQLYMDGQYVKGKRAGLWKFYKPNGALEKEIDFDSTPQSAPASNQGV